ncbi:MAG: hypothetical protein Q8Q05_00115 [bacterium]|nr:hypothetical protein [bacterium]
MPGSPEQKGENESMEAGELESENGVEKPLDHTDKTVEVAPGVTVVSMSHVIEDSATGNETGESELYVITRLGKKLIDSSDYFIDLQDAKLEGDEIVISYKKQEKHFKEREVWSEPFNNPNLAEKTDSHIEEVVEPQELEKRVPLHEQ